MSTVIFVMFFETVSFEFKKQKISKRTGEREDRMSLAEKIALLRKQKGWSQEELAERMDISRQSVSKWESGQSVPDLDKIIKISNIFAVSTDYLLKEDTEEEFTGREESDNADKWSESVKSVSMEEATAFMDKTVEQAKRMALAIASYVISPVCLILLGGMSEYGAIPMTENMAGGLGTAVLLVLVAIATTVVILSAMQLSKYEYLEKDRISIEYGVREAVEQRKEAFEPSFRKRIALGVAFCILGVVPLLLAAAADAKGIVYVCCIGILLFLIAFGVYFFVSSGMIHDSYEKLLQEGEYTVENKNFKGRLSFFSGAYWCTIVAVYLFINFYFDNRIWHKSWIIWPVAGVLYAALENIIKGIFAFRKK